MKFAVFLLFACCLAVCLAIREPRMSKWGRVTARTLGTRNVTVPADLYRHQSRNVTFTFPEWKSNYPIEGIQEMNFGAPVSMKFSNGRLGHTNLTLTVQSQPGQGINCIYIFYG